LALNPRILLLDEPLAGLDPYSRKSLITSLNRMVQNGLTLMLSTHNIDEIIQLASHTSLVRAGKLSASGDSRYIFSQPRLFVQAGLVAPLVPLVIERLRNLGWPIPDGHYREKELLADLNSMVGAAV
jgi:ABC-type multidrug transport system ATPase subunit